MKVSTVLNSKGGTGKTTFISNTAAMLADVAGQRVLLIDADKQPTLSSMFALEHRAPHGISSLLRDGVGNPSVVSECISHTTIPGLDIVVSDADKGELESWVFHNPDGRIRLRVVLTQLRDQYDHVLIDTCGSVGPIQEAAIIAADRVISPVPPTILPVREFARGTLGMLGRTQSLISMISGTPPTVYVVPSMVDRTADARDMVAVLRAPDFATNANYDRMTVLESTIPSYVVYREASRERTPIHQMPRARGARATAALAAVVAELWPDHSAALRPLLQLQQQEAA